jgi:myo-inositol-1(or 4)-monophosphatase
VSAAPTSGAPSPVDLRVLAETLATEAAGIATELRAGGNLGITTKSTATDLVTAADTAAERHIVDRLRSLRPDDGLLGEEGASQEGTSGLRWVIDPIDGTVNFAHGYPGWAVSIAVEQRDHDGAFRAVAGCVAAPSLGEVFSAARGQGATRNGRPIEVSRLGASDLHRALLATGFGYAAERRVRQVQVLTRVVGRIADIRRGGAASMDFCHVACGRVDAYAEVGLNPWDVAAGGLIAAEAGAVVHAGLDGAPPGFAFAATPAIADELLAVLAAAGFADV